MDRELVERRIREAMVAAAKSEMRWGVDDCVFWCADILAPAIGCDLVQSYRGKFRSRRGAYKVMGKGGLRGCLDRLAAERGWSWVPPERALTGDVGLAQLLVWRQKRKVALPSTVICRAPGWFVGRSECGWVAIPAKEVTQAWGVK